MPCVEWSSVWPQSNAPLFRTRYGAPRGMHVPHDPPCRRHVRGREALRPRDHLVSTQEARPLRERIVSDAREPSPTRRISTTRAKHGVRRREHLRPVRRELRPQCRHGSAKPRRKDRHHCRGNSELSCARRQRAARPGHQCRHGLLLVRARAPRRKARVVRRRGESALPRPAPCYRQRWCQQGHQDDRRRHAILGGIARGGEQAEEHQVVHEMRDDGDEHTEVDHQHGPEARIDEDFHSPRIRRPRRIIGVREAERQCCRDHTSRHPPATSRTLPHPQRQQRQRQRAEQRLLPHAGVERHRDAGQPRHRRRNEVGIVQHLAGYPPAEHRAGHQVEQRHVRKPDGRDRVSAGHARGHLARAAISPQLPPVELLGKRQACCQFRRGQRETSEQPGQPSRQ